MSGPWEREDVPDAKTECWRCHGYFSKPTMTYDYRIPWLMRILQRWPPYAQKHWFCATCYAKVRLYKITSVIVIVAAIIIGTVFVYIHL